MLLLSELLSQSCQLFVDLIVSQNCFVRLEGMSKSNRFVDVVPKLSEESMAAIESFGFTHMTPVQATSIPLFLQHKVRHLIALHQNQITSNCIVLFGFCRMFVWKQRLGLEKH
jgi:hypothetical protein